MAKFFKHKDKLYEAVAAGPWEAAVPLEAEEAAPLHRWLGGKIPLGLVRQITAFFEWSLKETNGETVVHLFYNEDAGEWKAAVLPQKGYTGMSVTLLENHPGRVEAIEALGPGFEPAGTWHHHCKTSAFQSHTDEHDERDVFGLHVTVGNVGSDKYDLDLRCSFRKHFTRAVLSDWVALPPLLEQMDLPPAVANPLVLHLVATPEPDTPFPEGWKANVIRVPVQAAPPTVGSLWRHGGQYEWRPAAGFQGPAVFAQTPSPAPKSPAHEKVGRDELGYALEEICWFHGLEPEALAAIIEKDYEQDQLLLDLAKVMVEFETKADDVIQALREKSLKERLDALDREMKYD